jgi:hypothetical protein
LAQRVAAGLADYITDHQDSHYAWSSSLRCVLRRWPGWVNAALLF